MERIIDYLNRTYDPEAVIVYGSYVDGSNNVDSDFDCLVISGKNGCKHDTSCVGGVVLDAFIYSAEEVSADVDCYEFLQIHDGKIIKDTDGIAAGLQQKVKNFLENQPPRTYEDIQGSIAWCEKMLRRTQRGDTEGYFRWHWLLHDSLEIYCDICGQYYFGPKKSIRFMEKTDPAGYELYTRALRCFVQEDLQAWIDYLCDLAENR